MSQGATWRILSALCFILFFATAFTCCSFASVWHWKGRGDSGSLILRGLPNSSSAGAIPVKQWGMAQFLRSFYGWPSTWAAHIVFSRVRIKRSACALAWGHRGVISLCLRPKYGAKWSPRVGSGPQKYTLAFSQDDDGSSDMWRGSRGVTRHNSLTWDAASYHGFYLSVSTREPDFLSDQLLSVNHPLVAFVCEWYCPDLSRMGDNNPCALLSYLILS